MKRAFLSLLTHCGCRRPQYSVEHLKDWLFCRCLFVQRVINMSSVCIVSSGKSVGNANKFVFTLAPEIYKLALPLVKTILP